LDWGSGIATAVLGAGVLFCLATSLSSATSPAKFAERLGLAVANAGGVNEIRAQYAGFFLAVALACAGALIGVVPRAIALAVLVVVFGGLFAGRLAALALNRGLKGFGRTIIALHVIDLAAFCASTFALALNR
jgi:hypothetical protein